MVQSGGRRFLNTSTKNTSTKNTSTKELTYLYIGLVGIIVLSTIGLTFYAAHNDFLTGAALSQSSTLSITLNSIPVVNNVLAVSSQSITEASTTAVKFTFNVTDQDGSGDINNNSARLALNLSGQTTRINTSCTANQTVSNTTTFNCVVRLWYFDASGNWTINVSINDTGGAFTQNITTSLELLSTTAVVINPTALAWATLLPQATNQTSNSDPITLNNTGNKNIATTGITMTGYDLQGITTTTDYIRARNFSVSNLNGSSSCSGVACLECNGTIMVNATAEVLPDAILSRGNNSQNYQNDTSGQENLFFCLMTVPSEISRQTYNTAGANTASWTVTVS